MLGIILDTVIIMIEVRIVRVKFIYFFRLILCCWLLGLFLCVGSFVEGNASLSWLRSVWFIGR
jgi:hypothetical protein